MGIHSSRLWIGPVVCLSLAAAGCASGGGSEWALWKSNAPGQADVKLKDPAKTHLAYGKWQEQLGKLADARRSYERVLGEDPDSIEAVLGLARLDQLGGRTQEAELGFKKALKLKPNDPHALDALGQFYAAQQRWPEAIEALNAAMLAAPAESTYRFHLAVALAQSGDVESAMPHFVKTVGEAEARYNIGYILHQKGDLDGARRQYLQAVTLRPDLRQAQEMLDELVRDQQDKLLAEGSQPLQRMSHSTARSGQATRAAVPRGTNAGHWSPARSGSGATGPRAAYGPAPPSVRNRSLSGRPNQAGPGAASAAGADGSASGNWNPRRQYGSASGRPTTPHAAAVPPGELTPEQIEQWRNQQAGGQTR